MHINAGMKLLRIASSNVALYKRLIYIALNIEPKIVLRLYQSISFRHLSNFFQSLQISWLEAASTFTCSRFEYYDVDDTEFPAV